MLKFCFQTQYLSLPIGQLLKNAFTIEPIYAEYKTIDEIYKR